MQVRWMLDASGPVSHLRIRLPLHFAPPFHRCSESTHLLNPMCRREERGNMEDMGIGRQSDSRLDHFHELGMDVGGCDLAMCPEEEERGLI